MAARPETPTAAAHAYRREIDGLRAVAVLPVILFHAGLPAFEGGYLGVDVFFVISGYLITGILVRDLRKGRFSLARFYERRARRILPALTVVLLACIPFAVSWMSPLQLEELARGFVAATLSVSNILNWLELDYFGPSAETLPLLHTWSLGIEEQFYLLFPLALAGLWRFRRSVVLATVTAALAVSLALAALASESHPSASFFLLPFRAWELLLGASLALALERASLPAPGALASAGLGLLVLAMAGVPLGILPGILPLLLAAAGTALMIGGAVPGTPVQRLLATPLLVGIGLISYSAYLWHQPILAFARIRFGPLEPALAVALGAAAVAVAWPTWAFVERPFRRPSAGPPRGPLLAAAASLAVLLAIGAGGLASNGLEARKSSAVRAIMATVKDTNPHRETCKTDLVDANPVHPVAGCLVDGAEPAVAFYGDSHADAIQGGLWPLAERAGFRFYSVTRSACPPIAGLDRTGTAASPDCDAWVRGVEDFAGAAGFDVVVLAARWTAGVALTAFDNGEGGREGPPADYLVPIGTAPRSAADREAAVIARYVAGIEDLLRAGHAVVLVYPIPEAGWNVIEELARRREQSEVPISLSTGFDVFQRRHAAVISAFDAIASPDLFRVRPSDRLCDADLPGRCINNLGDRPLYFDNNHLNTYGAGLVSPMILDAIEAARRGAVSTEQAGNPASLPGIE